MNKTVLKETLEAYADSAFKLNWNTAESRRDLNFRASEPVTRPEAIEIMTKALRYSGGGYNEFTPNVLNELPADSQIYLAREYSVCVYVTLEEGTLAASGLYKEELETLRAKMSADECDITSKGELRIWWD